MAMRACSQERLFAVTAKFRTSMKYTRKFVWWNTIKQVIEETNHAKMESYVDFSIGKILSSKAAIVSKQAEYTAQLKAFMASKEGEGLITCFAFVCWSLTSMCVHRNFV